MNSRQLTNFGELYRAAFAEPDLRKKEALLMQVKLAIDSWQKMVEERDTDTQKRTVTGVSEPPAATFRQIA